MLTKVDYTRLPRVPVWRRGVAFAIDFCCAWLLSSLLGANLITGGWIIVFVLAWLGLRVLLPYGNQGQSLGRWALDMKLIDFQLGKSPGLQALLKREGVAGGGAVLAAITLNNITNFGALLLLLPLALDCGMTLSEPEFRQAFHDRIARTIVAPTRRGYSLDLKVKRLLAQLRQSVRR